MTNALLTADVKDIIRATRDSYMQQSDLYSGYADTFMRRKDKRRILQAQRRADAYLVLVEKMNELLQLEPAASE
jgi:hypothetical protein